jgi:hypothetical protein
MRGLSVAALLLLAGCELANLLPGGGSPQRAIESGVVHILNLRADFDRYAALLRQFDAAEARGDRAAAERLQAALSAVVDESRKTRGGYNDRLVRTAKTFAPDTIKLALEAVVARYDADGANALTPFARLFAQHVLNYQTAGSADFDKLYEEFLR